MRKTIFDIASESIDMPGEVKRIIKMSNSEETLVRNSYSRFTLFDFVDEYCFHDWKERNHFINVNDYLNAINFKKLVLSATSNTDDFLTLIELVYNFWNLAEQKFRDPKKGYTLQWCGNFYHLRDVMDDILDQYNHKAYMNDKHTCVYVVENNQAVTAAVEILPPSLALDVIKYNHKSLQGEIELKKNILITLASELEPKKKELTVVNKQLSDDVFYILNNFNIRHNNLNSADSAKYKAYVANMSKEKLESWYDELFQMILLANLLLNNTARTERIKKLKAKTNNT